MPELPKLYTFSISHFSEKARWFLEASQIAFREVPWTPFFHLIGAYRSGGKSTVPVFEVDGKRIQDSTRIFLWLDQKHGPLALLPQDSEQRKQVLALEEQFDRVGEDVVRYAYRDALDDSESVIRYWTLDAAPWQTRLLRRNYRIMRFVFRLWVRLNSRSVVRAEQNIDAGLSLIEAHLQTGKQYLIGDRLSIADLTAAALLAPLACPDEHPIYGSERYRAGARSVADKWKHRPAFEWVRKIYREHRAPSARLQEIRAALAQEPSRATEPERPAAPLGS